MNIRAYILLFVTLFAFTSKAQEAVDSAYLAEIESLMEAYELQKKSDNIRNVIDLYEDEKIKKELSFDTEGFKPLLRGLLLRWTDKHFYSIESQFPVKSESYNWKDNIVAATPLAVSWAMKAAGVKSRSKIDRMLSANALSLGISSTVTSVIKGSVYEMRPDMSNQSSFPSGHTSMAFACASILSREYGHVSPWVTIGSFTTATATQYCRIKHNRHWMSDIYTGAGIGMLSTSLGYYITDLVMGEAGINDPEVSIKDIQRLARFNEMPSGFSLVSGLEVGSRTISFDGVKMKAGASFTAGFDVTLFSSTNYAVEFISRVTEAQTKMYGQDRLFTGDNIDIYHFCVAGKYSYPFDIGRRVGVRLLGGARILNGITLTDGVSSYSVADEKKLELGAGINYECIETDNYVWGFNVDYYHTFSHNLSNRYAVSSVWKILF